MRNKKKWFCFFIIGIGKQILISFPMRPYEIYNKSLNGSNPVHLQYCIVLGVCLNYMDVLGVGLWF